MPARQLNKKSHRRSTRSSTASRSNNPDAIQSSPRRRRLNQRVAKHHAFIREMQSAADAARATRQSHG